MNTTPSTETKTMNTTPSTETNTTFPKTDEKGRVYISYVSFENGEFQVYTFPFSAGEIREWKWLYNKFDNGLAFLSVEQAKELARKLTETLRDAATIPISRVAYFDARRAATDK